MRTENQISHRFILSNPPPFLLQDPSAPPEPDRSGAFHERFYVVLIEKQRQPPRQAVLHTWLLDIASQPPVEVPAEVPAGGPPAYPPPPLVRPSYVPE